MPASDRCCARLHDAGERRGRAALDHAAGRSDAAACEEKEAPKDEAEGAFAGCEEARAEAGCNAATPDASTTLTDADPDRRTIPIVDLVYGAYQRGMYKTAFDLATTRARRTTTMPRR